MLKFASFFILLLALGSRSLSLASGFEAQGQVSLFGWEMPAEDLPDVSKEAAGTELKLQSRYLFSKSLSLRFQPWFQNNNLSRDPAERNQFELPDFSLEWKKSSRKIRVGLSTLNWEGTDFLNPMDVLSVKNWRDPFNAQPRGMAGLFYSDQVGSFSWDLAFIPQQTEALVPGNKSPWWPRRVQLPTESTDSESLLLPTDQVNYDILPNQILNQADKNNAALRLQYHGDSWDFSVAGAEGVAAPLLSPILAGTVIEVSPKFILRLTSPIAIQPLLYRQRIGATALTKTWGSWIFRLAFQHAQPLGDDFRLPGWSEYGVLGIEKNVEWGSQNLTLLFQYTASHLPHTDSVSVASSLLERAIMVGWRWPLTEKLSWTSGFFQEQKYSSFFAHSEVAWSFSDHWSSQVAAEIFSGNEDSAIGLYKHDNRYTIRVIYAF